jgi:hypothetical protein
MYLCIVPPLSFRLDLALSLSLHFSRLPFTLYKNLRKLFNSMFLLRYCATNQKVAGSIPDGVMEFYIDINPSDRTMALGSTQPLTEMSTGSISWW